MGPSAEEAKHQSDSNDGESHWSLVSVAFGAVSGTIIAILIQPLVDLLPAKLFEEFLSRIVEAILRLGLPVLFAYTATRIRRLDHFLLRYLSPAALIASVLLALSLWARSGWPTHLLAVISIVLTMLETCFFLLFCGSAVQLGLSQIVGKQEAVYKEDREAEAQRIAAQSIAEGDPDKAVTRFAWSAGGRVVQAMLPACLNTILLEFNIAAIFIVSSLDSHELFNLSWIWSVIAGAIIAAATMQIVGMSLEFGLQHAATVPLDEKYRGILTDHDDCDDAL